MLRRFLLLLSLSTAACASATTDTQADLPDAPPDHAIDEAPAEVRLSRIPDRSLVKWVSADPHAPWWIEEKLAPQQLVQGDRDLGPRALYRGHPARTVVWEPPARDRLIDAARTRSGRWVAVGVDDDQRIFLATGTEAGLEARALVEDPDLRADTRAWLDTPRDVPRINVLSELSPKIVADGETMVVSFMSQDYAVLAYRFAWSGGALVRSARTLVSPAMRVTPFLPIGGSFDDFDSMAAPYVTHLGVDASGRAFVVHMTDKNRLARHNAVFGTSLDLLRSELPKRENTLDALVTGLERDGRVAFSTVVGTVDVEDEVFGVAVGESELAVLGRSRRELGRDNTELHAMIARLSRDGLPLRTHTFDGADSALAQTAAYDGGALWVGGTEGWLQNPSGRSLYAPGHPFLVRLEGGNVLRFDGFLPPTTSHAELRAVGVNKGTILLGGHENGPLTHTADADRSLVRSDAWFAIRSL